MRYSAYNIKEEVYQYIKSKPGCQFSEITVKFNTIGIIDLEDLVKVLIQEKRVVKKWHIQTLGLFCI